MFRYDNNEMYTEALNTYAVITKNRMFNNAGKLKVMTLNWLLKRSDYRHEENRKAYSMPPTSNTTDPL